LKQRRADLPNGENRANPACRGELQGARLIAAPPADAAVEQADMKLSILPPTLAAACALVLSGCAHVNPFVGRHIAETICDACHQIDPTYPPNPKFIARSFLDISRMPSMDEPTLKAFLRTSHPATRHIVLNDEELDSIAVYIASLSGR
jgi:hypothetical protein